MTEEKPKEEMGHRLEELEEIREFLVGGETTIEDEAIATIVSEAAGEVEGIASLGTSSIRRTLAEHLGGTKHKARGVEVEAGTKEAIVDITLNVLYGYNIPSIVMELRGKIAARLLELTGLLAKEINIRVVGIEFPKEPTGKRK